VCVEWVYVYTTISLYRCVCLDLLRKSVYKCLYFAVDKTADCHEGVHSVCVCVRERESVFVCVCVCLCVCLALALALSLSLSLSLVCVCVCIGGGETESTLTYADVC
jgi:hypothetical protein